MHGVLQIIEKAFGWQKYEGKNWAVRMLRIAVTFLLVSFAWVFFRMPNIVDAFEMIGRMFTAIGHFEISAFGGITNVVLSLTGVILLTCKDVKDEYLGKYLQWLQKPVLRWSIYVFLFAFIIAFGVLDSGQFIYVNF